MIESKGNSGELLSLICVDRDKGAADAWNQMSAIHQQFLTMIWNTNPLIMTHYWVEAFIITFHLTSGWE